MPPTSPSPPGIQNPFYGESVDILRKYTFFSKAWFTNVHVSCHSSQGTYKQVPNEPIKLHSWKLFTFHGYNFTPLPLQRWKFGVQTMLLFFSTVQGGGIQSKTYLISTSSLNKSLHETSLFLNESQIYNKHKNLPIHSQSTTSVPWPGSSSYVFFLSL